MARTIFIGNIYESNNFGKFRVIGYENTKSIDIEFINTGYVTTTTSMNISKGKIRDPFVPTAFGIGYLGSSYDEDRNREYIMWYNMMANCYGDRGHSHYEDVSVCDKWHNFTTFCEDIKKLPGYQTWKDNPDSRRCIARSLKYTDNKVFSPSTCEFSVMSEYCAIIGRRVCEQRWRNKK